MQPAGPSCPACGRNMAAVALGGARCEVDVCPGCQLVWCDAGELESLGPATQAGGSTIGEAARAVFDVVFGFMLSMP
ncbi:MAG: zf-TFIIB domain-containing protein [Candidatus Binatia bacterium]